MLFFQLGHLCEGSGSLPSLLGQCPNFHRISFLKASLINRLTPGPISAHPVYVGTVLPMLLKIATWWRLSPIILQYRKSLFLSHVYFSFMPLMPYMPIMFSMFFMVDLLGCRGFFRPCRPFAVAIKICSSSSQRVYQRCNQSGGSGSTWKR